MNIEHYLLMYLAWYLVTRFVVATFLKVTKDWSRAEPPIFIFIPLLGDFVLCLLVAVSPLIGAVLLFDMATSKMANFVTREKWTPTKQDGELSATEGGELSNVARKRN